MGAWDEGADRPQPWYPPCPVSLPPRYNPGTPHMSLAPGTRIGPYEIVSMVGAGGMGEVYRARDTSLKRDVALKTLPESFASDSERLARFQREAELLASLNHPNIAAIYGLAEGDGVKALVMEFVDGEDLADRIAHGPIPLDEALPMARQIVDALEAAHEHGIIHRDLKPANIKLRGDGTVKVLDFGLAKAIEPAGAMSPAIARSPTITSPAMIDGGRHAARVRGVYGPEQARGKAVDKRADIWAFGCVLDEMLTGTPLFAGVSVPETLGFIFSREPDLTILPAATPARVRALIARCLVKDPRQRLRDIGETRLALDAAHETTAAIESAPTPGFWRAVPWVVAAALALVAGWALWTRTVSSTTAPPLTHLGDRVPTRRRALCRHRSGACHPSRRPDGSDGWRERLRRVFIRRLDRAAATELPDTEGAQGAVFSPDGGSVAVLLSSGLITRIDLADQQRRLVTSGQTSLSPSRRARRSSSSAAEGSCGSSRRKAARRVGSQKSGTSALCNQRIGATIWPFETHMTGRTHRVFLARHGSRQVIAALDESAHSLRGVGQRRTAKGSQSLDVSAVTSALDLLRTRQNKWEAQAGRERTESIAGALANELQNLDLALGRILCSEHAVARDTAEVFAGILRERKCVGPEFEDRPVL